MAFSGKVIIITGSSSGIGQATAVIFAKAGGSVTIHGRSNEGLKKTKDMMLKGGASAEQIHSVQGPVNEESTLKALVDETLKKFGRIDVLINNVGIAIKEGCQNTRSMENLDYLLEVNLKSVIHLTELAIPHLEKTKGNIINVGSALSQKTHPMNPFYSILKAALDHFTRNYAAILAPKGIRVNSLNPGITDTQFGTRHGYPKEISEKYAKTIPIARPGNPKEMGRFLSFIASDKAAYLTGQVIVLDGGSLISSPNLKLD